MSTLQPQPSSYIKLISQSKQQLIQQQLETEAKDHCITRQASKKQLSPNVLDSQKTYRMKNFSGEELPQINHISQSKLEPALLIELTNEIDLQRQAIERANQIITYLKQENQKLSSQLQIVVKQLQCTHLFYKEQFQSAGSTMTKLEQFSNRNIQQSFIQPRSSKTTPVKIYGKADEPIGLIINGQSSLQQIQRIVLKQNIINTNNELSKLHQLAQSQCVQLKTMIEQQKYLQAFVEDQILTINSNSQPLQMPNVVNYQQFAHIQSLLKSYQQQILNWQSYASTLRKQLLDCISYIEELIPTKQIICSPKSDFTYQDLLKFITKQICKMCINKDSKKQKQINQLKDILQQLFTKLKKKEIYFKNPIEKYIS